MLEILTVDGIANLFKNSIQDTVLFAPLNCMGLSSAGLAIRHNQSRFFLKKLHQYFVRGFFKDFLLGRVRLENVIKIKRISSETLLIKLLVYAAEQLITY